MWRPDDFLALPEHVIAFAWQAPLRELAARVGISDVGLKKLLNGQGIVTPPQGYWNRVHAGKPVVSAPRPAPRRPGERGRVKLDSRFRGHVAEALPMPEDGPFASREVPEDLAELRTRELGRIGRIAVPRDLARPHPGLAKLLRSEEARREKAAASRWHWDEPHFSGPLAQRQLRLCNALLLALARRGHNGEAWDENEELRLGCTIGDTQLALQFAVVGKHRTEMRGGRQRPARDLPAKTALRLSMRRQLRAQLTTAWEDSDGQPLEKQLAEIAADLIAAGEAAFRQGLVEAREHAEEMQRWREKRRLERQAQLNKERLAHLDQSGALLRQADDLRSLVERVNAAVLLGQLAVSALELDTWRAWALRRADELDPVMSGQVLRHIRSDEAD